MRMELYKYVNNRNLYIPYEYVCRFISQFKEVMIMSTSIMFHFSNTHRKILSVSEHFGTLYINELMVQFLVAEIF